MGHHVDIPRWCVRSCTTRRRTGTATTGTDRPWIGAPDVGNAELPCQTLMVAGIPSRDGVADARISPVAG
jgi:hypothetical protein